MSDQAERARVAAENALAKKKRREVQEESLKRILAYDPEITAEALAARLGIGRGGLSEMCKRLGLQLQRGRR
jgi:hypothetical protein